MSATQNPLWMVVPYSPTPGGAMPPEECDALLRRVREAGQRITTQEAFAQRYAAPKETP
ncbi:MAG: hypothetical protein ACFE0O_00115 [Opitutales bacterium]